MRESYEPSPKGEGGRGPARGRMRGQVTVISRKRVAMASSALISRLAATASPDGEAFRADSGIDPHP